VYYITHDTIFLSLSIYLTIDCMDLLLLRFFFRHLCSEHLTMKKIYFSKELKFS